MLSLTWSAIAHVCLRLGLCAILLSTGLPKLWHLRRFQQAVQEYRLLPAWAECWVAIGFPLVELCAGLGLLTASWLPLSIMLTIELLLVASGAIVLNLLRGRTDLSCHCGGVIGNHNISWWLVGRNLLLVGASAALLVLPVDPFTLQAVLHHPVSVMSATWLNTLVPIALLIITLLALLLLLTQARLLRNL